MAVIDLSMVMAEKKPYADSTLKAMKKDELIELIRMWEYNYNVATSFNRQQAENYKMLLEKERKEVAREIFAEIETVLCHSVYPFVKGNGQIGTKKSRDLHIRFEDFAELKKKYTEGEE